MILTLRDGKLEAFCRKRQTVTVRTGTVTLHNLAGGDGQLLFDEQRRPYWIQDQGRRMGGCRHDDSGRIDTLPQAYLYLTFGSVRELVRPNIPRCMYSYFYISPAALRLR